MDVPRLLTVPEAQARILARFRTGNAETIAASAALGRTLARDVVAASDLPPFTHSAMDGYAIRAADTGAASPASPTMLRVTGIHAAGERASLTIGPGEAIAITTGAPLPRGADAVVRLEEVQSGPESVTIHAAVTSGANVRRQGENLGAGAMLLAAGVRIGPGQIALLTAGGIARVPVVRLPRIAYLSTGNELVPLGQARRPGEIVDVNGPMLAALITAFGGQPLSLGIARDTPRSLHHALDTAHDVDLILTTGGVSVGAYDAVRAVIAAHGTLDFWQVRMRPGRPVAFGRIGETPILALPGNPVAAFVAFHLLARPAIARMRGETPELPPTVPVRLQRAVEQRGGHQSYLRARLRATVDGWDADPAVDQGTGNVLGLAADALVILPEGVAHVMAGDLLPAIPLNHSSPSHIF